MVMRLGETMAIKQLSAQGFEISKGTYWRDRAKIVASTETRKFELAKEGLFTQHLARIDNLETVLSELWIRYGAEHDNYKAAKILEIIANLQPWLSAYYDASQKVIIGDFQATSITGIQKDVSSDVRKFFDRANAPVDKTKATQTKATGSNK